MKYKFFQTLIPIMTSLSLLQAQQSVEVVEGFCFGYTLQVDKVDLEKLDECSFALNEETNDQLMTMAANYNSSTFVISAKDIIAMVNGLLDGFPNNQSIYQADYDQDGVVSTYDIAALNSYILGFEPLIENPYHIVSSIEEIPMLDPFNINVDYSELTFSQDDFINDELAVRVIVVGDIE